MIGYSKAYWLGLLRNELGPEYKVDLVERPGWQKVEITKGKEQVNFMVQLENHSPVCYEDPSCIASKARLWHSTRPTKKGPSSAPSSGEASDAPKTKGNAPLTPPKKVASAKKKKKKKKS